MGKPKNSQKKKLPGKNRQYSPRKLKDAVRRVLHDGWSVYKTSKELKVPWTTVKENVARVREEETDDNFQFTPRKIGRPFSLTVDVEQQLLKYIIEMQELGFGLTVTKIRNIAFELAVVSKGKHHFNPSKAAAGWNWWIKYKERYGLALRQPENLSAARATVANREIISDFYEKLKTTLTQAMLHDLPERLWNCDETGLMYVVKGNRIVTATGKKYIYNRTYAEKGTTTTALACVNAIGMAIPPMIIFKGIRALPALNNGALPGALVKVSPKGWINSDLFVDWIRHFVKNIPPARPVLLLMDSHGSHVGVEALQLAKENNIILFTMPSHTSHLLQPLDVSVYRALKQAWRNELENFRAKNTDVPPTRFDFHTLFNPAYEKAMTPSNIRAGFAKSGVYPINETAIPDEALTASRLTETRNTENTPSSSATGMLPTSPCDDNQLPSPETDDTPTEIITTPEKRRRAVTTLLATPVANPSRKKKITRRKTNFRAKCLTPPDQPSTSGTSSTVAETVSDECDDDWICGVCEGSYYADVKKRNGAEWICCSFCATPYHVKCQASEADSVTFMCDNCANIDDDD